MKNYLEKLQSNHLGLGFWKTRGEGSMDSPESGWSYKMQEDEKKKKGWSLSNWILITLPIISFLCLGIYFIIVDAKILTSVGDKTVYVETKPSESSWGENTNYIHQQQTAKESKPLLKKELDHLEITTPAEEISVTTTTTTKITEGEPNEDEEDPNLVVRFDYVDLSSEDLPTDEEFLNGRPNFNDSKETIIILKNDDNGKKIFLKTSATFREFEEQETVEKTETTTAKSFVYSPTIPQSPVHKTRVDVTTTTKKYNFSEESRCFSTKLSFCEGILPYDVVQLPNLPGIKRYSDLATVLPYFQMIIDSGCSLRAKEFICSVLEPECQPEGKKQNLPCRLNCKVVSDDCRDYILQTLPLSKIFDCRRYPDWDESYECLNMSKGKCHGEEFQCSDGTCIPLKWVCDGVHDCPGSRPSFDESNCQGCSENEFRCVMDGKCVPLTWKCDGQVDCIDHSDEMSCIPVI